MNHFDITHHKHMYRPKRALEKHAQFKIAHAFFSHWNQTKEKKNKNQIDAHL